MFEIFLDRIQVGKKHFVGYSLPSIFHTKSRGAMSAGPREDAGPRDLARLLVRGGRRALGPGPRPPGVAAGAELRSS